MLRHMRSCSLARPPPGKPRARNGEVGLWDVLDNRPGPCEPPWRWTPEVPLLSAGGARCARSSEGGKPSAPAHRKGLLDARDLLPAKPEARRGGVLPDPSDLRGLGDGEEVRIASQERERHLVGRHPVLPGDLAERLPPAGLRLREVAGTEGAVTHHRHVVLHAPGDDAILDVPRAQVVQDLVAGNAPWPRDRQRLLELVHVEVA